MGMNLLLGHALDDLRNRGVLKGLTSVLDVGVHYLATLTNRPRCYEDFVRARFGDEIAGNFVSEAYTPDGAFTPTAHHAFYRLFGLSDYSSLDFIDPNASYHGNLNEQLSLGRRFDLISDFGTSEHIFNIGQAIKNMHDHLNPGGLMFFQVPTLGGYYHGFYSVHNVFYRSIAEANNYEVVTMMHVNDNWRDLSKFERSLKLPWLQDIRHREPRLMSSRFYLHDLWSILTNGPRVLADVIAVLRKNEDKPFVVPQQINKYPYPKSKPAP